MDEEALTERKADGQGLTAPEFAILLSYTKIALYEELLASDAERLAASASAAGADVTYTRWPRMWHDFVLHPGLVAAADSAVAQAAWFVDAVTAV